ncbi:MAG: TonB-dependent receptor [Campylobacterales bacterium]|nr:TonB-dependent receptor [Campylobacterales bacterium]
MYETIKHKERHTLDVKLALTTSLDNQKVITFIEIENLFNQILNERAVSNGYQVGRSYYLGAQYKF